MLMLSEGLLWSFGFQTWYPTRFLAAFVAVGATLAFLRRSRQIREHEDYVPRQKKGTVDCIKFQIHLVALVADFLCFFLLLLSSWQTSSEAQEGHDWIVMLPYVPHPNQTIHLKVPMTSIRWPTTFQNVNRESSCFPTSRGDASWCAIVHCAPWYGLALGMTSLSRWVSKIWWHSNHQPPPIVYFSVGNLGPKQF